ncbi:hypothetical protein [Luteirhabdus pelagi]|uniref:hypothetical protein n=1 Tax=Luteirhabdus pelagi TaxID=2792783 RepID=UPI001939D15C|nr:hypothetical protein [Luteirhabdus pelagi]
MTDHLVLNIARYRRVTGDNTVDIFKLPWTIESVYGNDLDLFIEKSNGTFDWYSLQAKIMGTNGAFKDIKNPTGGNLAQWNKLKVHERLFGSKTFYLLYCGNPQLNRITQSPTRSDCIGIPNVEEYGLTIVETDIIKNLRERILSPYGQLFFNNVFPNDTDSIRKLFCCLGKTVKSKKQFKFNEINTKNYQRIYWEDQQESSDNQKNLESEDFIETSENGESKYRIIIKTTANNGYK